MFMPIFKRLTLAAIACLFLASPALAADPLAPAGVDDSAAILSNAAETELKDLIARHQLATGGAILVRTELQRDPAAAKEGQDRVAYVQALGRVRGVLAGSDAAQAGDRGLIYVVNAQEKFIIVEIGRSIARQLTRRQIDQITFRTIIPDYNENKMDDGTIKGVRALINALTPTPAAAYYPMMASFALLALIALYQLLKSTGHSWRADPETPAH